MSNPVNLPQDFAELLAEFASADVRYLIIGGYAVGFHDRPRTTKDIDLLLDSSEENLRRVTVGLQRFGAPRSVVDDIVRASLDEIVWLGTPPVRVDLLKSAPGVDFEEAYSRRQQSEFMGVSVSIISLEDLIASKRAADRDQDRLDVANLERVRETLAK